MKITTSKGKTFPIVSIVEMFRNGNQILIDLPDDRLLSEVAADFEGLETITMTNTKKPGKKEVYEGFTHLADVHQNKAAGTVRLTLEKGDAA